MKSYLVWNAENGETAEDAAEFAAYDHASAAVEYATLDTDGQIDRIYESPGATLHVLEMGDTEVAKIEIEVEYEPSFYTRVVE